MIDKDNRRGDAYPDVSIGVAQGDCLGWNYEDKAPIHVTRGHGIQVSVTARDQGVNDIPTEWEKRKKIAQNAFRDDTRRESNGDDIGGTRLGGQQKYCSRPDRSHRRDGQQHNL